jgi:hypothetical protein
MGVVETILFVFSFLILLILSLVVFLAVVILLWRRGKTVEALLVWNSMFLYIIAWILFLK